MSLHSCLIRPCITVTTCTGYSVHIASRRVVGVAHAHSSNSHMLILIGLCLVHAGNHTPPWGAGRGEESSGSEVGNADVESLDDEPSPVTPSPHLMLSSNNSEVPPEHSDQALLADELV